jgi:L-2-hydroxyglutarate oxidase LhgO
MHLYLRDAEAAGACCVYHSQVTGVTRISGGYRLEVVGPDGERSEVDSERVVNAAGLFADRVAALAGIDIDQAGYRLKRCRGDYFSTRPRCWKLVSRLIYPVPVAHTVGLGIHVTLDLAGRLRLGPDTTWIEDDGPLRYAADPGKRAAFLQAVQRYLPGLSAEDLEPEFAGIRPKLQGPGEPTRDFVICEESARGLPGFVNLIGIESPGLTASPAIAREVRRQLEV